MFTLLKQEGAARRGQFETVHGTIQTPVFKIKEEGVYFNSHVDGRRIFMGPEESMQIQSHLASTIAMAFDECVENPAEHSYSKASCDRTVRWLERCVAEQKRLNGLEETINKHQMLFGINQGCTYEDLRIEHMKWNTVRALLLAVWR